MGSNMDINFELYKIFYHTARLQNFSEAAAALHISQSAVSQSIKNLEAKTGVSLFSRQGRQVKLTTEGRLLYRHIEQAYNFIKAGENKLAEMQNLDSGVVRIGAGDTVCKYFLIYCLERFNYLYPKIKIQVVNRTSPQLSALLKEGAVDLCIVTLPVADKGFKVTRYLTVKDIFVASGKFGRLNRGRISLAELSRYPLLLLEKQSATRQNLDRLLREKGIEVTPEIELEDNDLLVEFARIGLGVAHVLMQSALPAIRKGELFQVMIKEKLPKRELGIITAAEVPLSHAAAEFIKMLNPLGTAF